MTARSIARYAGVGTACAAAGVAGGIASGSASPAHPRAAARLGRIVHADAVVATARGTRFARVTIDRGTVKSVSGNQLTLDEGTAKATYRTVTLTIPSAAVVRNDGAAASLSSLQPGERVGVRQGPLRTRVAARHARR
jgi:hypothetical protein